MSHLPTYPPHDRRRNSAITGPALLLVRRAAQLVAIEPASQKIRDRARHAELQVEPGSVRCRHAIPEGLEQAGFEPVRRQAAPPAPLQQLVVEVRRQLLMIADQDHAARPAERHHEVRELGLARFIDDRHVELETRRPRAIPAAVDADRRRGHDVHGLHDQVCEPTGSSSNASQAASGGRMASAARRAQRIAAGSVDCGGVLDLQRRYRETQLRDGRPGSHDVSRAASVSSSARARRAVPQLEHLVVRRHRRSSTEADGDRRQNAGRPASQRGRGVSGVDSHAASAAWRSSSASTSAIARCRASSRPRSCSAATSDWRSPSSSVRAADRGAGTSRSVRSRTSPSSTSWPPPVTLAPWPSRRAWSSAAPRRSRALSMARCPFDDK